MIKKRIENIQSKLPEKTALLISDDANRFYFTGFHSSAGSVLITHDTATFFIDFRYFEKAKSTVTDCEVILAEQTLKQIKSTLEKHNITTLLIETECATVGRLNSLKKAMPDILISTDNCADKWISSLRAVKSSEELALIKQAQQLTDRTFDYILNNIKTGRTEREIALDMEFFMRKAGSEGVSFDFIAVSGKNSSLPHGVPTDKPLENGDFLTMDFGAVVYGYRSDMTRTVAIGSVTDEQKAVYDTVLSAQLCAIENIKSGKKCSEIDKIARDIIYNAGYKGCFGHGLGHSVGIEIHESPSLSPSCDELLKSGVVMTVEPGIYLENKFGVRIEDMVFVTDDGCENITKSRKDLIIL